MAVPLVASLVYFVLLAGSAAATAVYATAKAFTVVWPIVAVFVIEGVRFKGKRPDWRKHFPALPMGMATGLLIGGLIFGLYALTPLGEYARECADDVRKKVTEMGLAGPARYVTFCILLAGLHSLIEEFFWRWYVFGRLVMVAPRGVAYFFASLGFAGHHYVVLGCYFSAMGAFIFGTGVGIGGALWCWMYRRQGTLAGAWVSHALVDAAICYVGYQLIFA